MMMSMGFLLENDVDPDPFVQFRRWYEEAGVDEMALATATPEGQPSCRMVLLRTLDEEGFVFFTNLTSAKAADLDANPRAALLFRFPLRQVRVTGTVELVERDQTARYWATRPRGSQLAAWASPQSRVIEGRAQLDERLDELEELFGGDEIELPEHWGGYRVRPAAVEFWQHQEHRLHDRLRYRRQGPGWLLERLAP